MPTSPPTIQQLQRALAIAEQIQKLEEELAAVMGGSGSPAVAAPKAEPVKRRGRGGKRVVSAETRAKMAAAQQARRARSAGVSQPAAKGQKKKRVLSPEGRARIVAALKARHAARKASA